MKTAKLQVLAISDLNPADYNPRKKLKPGDREYESIKKSIEEFGFADPVVVNSDMTIIGGHQRMTVASDLGYTEVPCAIVDVDKTQEKALNIALNKITGEWNKELLADLIKELQEADFDMGKTGFEPPEIEQLFNSVHDKKVTEDDFDVDAELANALVYIMHEDRPLGCPTFHYYDICLEGYCRFGFDRSILEQALMDSVGKQMGKKLMKEVGYYG